MKLKHILAASACILSVGTAVLAQDTPTASTVLATVNGTDITVGHMIALTARLPEQYQSIPDDQLFKGVLDQLIHQSAISSAADRDSLAMRLAIENETRALLAGETLDEIGAAAATDAAVQAAYDAKYGDLPLVTEFKASHILVKTEDEAKALVEALAADADFAELAKEKSTGPSGASGGDLGWFPAEHMVPEFGDALKEMTADSISVPIQTQFGWHVIKLFETRDVVSTTLEDVRAEITAELSEAAVKAAITKFEADAEIVRSDAAVDPSVIRKTELLD